MPKIEAPRILYIGRGASDDKKGPDYTALIENGYTIDAIRIPETAWMRGLFRAFFINKSLKKYQIIIINEYAISWAILLRSMLSRFNASIILVGLNISARQFVTGVKIIDNLINFIWLRANLIIVHSHEEINIFHDLHIIPRERFKFCHWGFDLPSTDRKAYKPPYEKFISMIGRNNRDVRTFCEGVRKANTNGIIVTSQYVVGVLDYEIPDCITVEIDITLEKCISIIDQSVVHAVLVNDANRGAGHISAVTGMLLSKPHIFSEVLTLSDYLIDSYNGISVPLHDSDAFCLAISKILNDPAEASLLGDNGRSWALEMMSHRATTQKISELILSATDHQK